MQRGALERLSKAELIELVLWLQRPEKTSRTSSKPPFTDRKEKRADLPAEAAGFWECIELPAVRPQVVHHHHLAVRCPGCGTRAVTVLRAIRAAAA